MNGDAVGGLAAWVLDVMLTLGYVGVAALVALDNVFPPLPSELILPLAGFLSGQGRLELPLVILAATVGSVVGAVVLYGAGYWLGDAGLRPLVRRFGRWLFLREVDLDQAQDWFDRHGAKAVLFGRCVPLVRSLVSVPAGVARMPIWRFLTYTTLGSLAWNALLIGFGWGLGERWEAVGQYVKQLQSVVLVLAGVALLWFVVRRLRAKFQVPRPKLR